ncbi:response regulator transcription factor [Frankia sp. CiP3]|uniref:response regulator transcription factor n=1 Tax=Frankia sp. CiP3 TaxID=2880971 RepID=UPI001EF73356|nr:response regulator transcription factor [Frankia sp. CiP3]
MNAPAGHQPRLLLVEDERALAGLLAGVLGESGYAVELATDGQQGLHLGLTRRYDVAILDRGLPVLDGIDLLRALRRRGVAVPVLVLTARTAVADRVQGLDAGAEDYLGKPFDLDELLARLRALRRVHLAEADLLPLPDGRSLHVADRSVRLPDASPLVLSERECELLAVLATRPGQIFERDELRRRVFPEADPSVVDVYVHYLRRKLGRSIVRTIRGVGYRLGERG